MPIKFTPEEKRKLAESITKAACGIAQCWDTLTEIGARIGKDWEPQRTSVSDIADNNAAAVYDPAIVTLLDMESVAAYFEDEENWTREVKPSQPLPPRTPNPAEPEMAEAWGLA